MTDSFALTVAKARRDRSRKRALEALAELEADLKHIRSAMLADEPTTGRYGLAMQRLREACGGYDAAIDIIEAMEVGR